MVAFFFFFFQEAKAKTNVDATDKYSSGLLQPSTAVAARALPRMQDTAGFAAGCCSSPAAHVGRQARNTNGAQRLNRIAAGHPRRTLSGAKAGATTVVYI